MKKYRISSYAGWAYVLFWIIGLILEPGSPGVSASVADITVYYESHRVIHMIQAFLIDGAAGVTLLLFMSGLAVYFYDQKNSDKSILTSMYGASLVAASLSFMQGAFQQILSGPGMTTGGISPVLILSIISYIDAFKLTVLAVMVFLASILSFQTNSFHSWIRWTGILLTLLLLAGGLSFLVNTSILTMALYVSLPVLLIWVTAFGVELFRSQLPEQTKE